MRMDEVHKQDVDTPLSFDIVDDLHVFMRNDPMFYRKQYYPTMCNISNKFKDTKSSKLDKILLPMINRAADIYCKRFDLASDSKEIATIDDRKKLIQKIIDEETPRIKQGDYK